MMEWNAEFIILEPMPPYGIGTPITRWVNWNYLPDTDQGRVFMEGRQFSGSGGNTLVVTSYGTNRRLDLGGLMEYFIIIENIGPEVASFELVGVNFP
jgi:hypothetical protein